MVAKNSSGYQQIGAASSTVASSDGGVQTSTTTVRAVISQVAESTQAAVARQRPWSQLLDRQAIDKPSSTADAMSRMRKNLSYFRLNYIIFMLVLVGLSLLWHPVSLIVLALLVVAWIYFYFSRSEPVIMFNRTFSENEVLVILGIISVVALFMTKASSALSSAMILGVVLIAVHAAFRRPDDLFLEEQDNAASGLFSFPTSNGASRV